jgi:hypothetical protein
MPNALEQPSAIAEILHPVSRQLYRHWDSVRGQLRAARRSDLDLRQMRKVLPWTFISELDPASGEHRIRLAGTGICRIWMDNLTGKFPFSTWSRFTRRTLNSLLRDTVENQRPFAVRVRARSGSGEWATLEIVGLPVEAQGTAQIQVLGVMVPFHQFEWLGRSPLVSVEMSSVRVLRGDRLRSEALTAAKQLRRAGKPKREFGIIKGGRTD